MIRMKALSRNCPHLVFHRLLSEAASHHVQPKQATNTRSQVKLGLPGDPCATSSCVWSHTIDVAGVQSSLVPQATFPFYHILNALQRYGDVGTIIPHYLPGHLVNDTQNFHMQRFQTVALLHLVDHRICAFQMFHKGFAWFALPSQNASCMFHVPCLQSQTERF